MINYNFNDQYNFLEVKVSGILKIEDIINHYNKISKDDSLPDNLKSIIDCRNAKFDIDAESITLTYKSVKNALKRFDTIKDAVIVNSPFETAVAVIFERINIILNTYSCAVFSTKEASQNWLINKSQKVLVFK